MGSALDSASLIMYPSGYSDGVLGSAKPTDGSGDFTFTRGSNLSATRVGPNGYIEKGYENLLLYSNDFSQWTTNGIDETSGQAGYDGSNDAWLIEKTNISTRVERSVSYTGVSTFSVYAKAGTLNWIKLNASNVSKYYDLENGVLGSTSGTPSMRIDFQIESVGNGWYRCSITTNQTIGIVRIYPAQDNNDDSGTSGSIYIQDAMLNQGLVAYPYIETTTAPVAGGILEDEPRIDFSGGCGHLLLEPQRTNLMVQSEYLGSNWYHTNTNYESNATASPEGLINSTKVFADTSFASHYLERIGFTGFTSGNYTYSFFAKSAGSDFVQIATSTGFDSRYQNFNLTTGQKASGDADLSGYDTSITAIGDDGWYRLTITANAPSASVRFLIVPILTDAGRNPSFTGDGTSGVYIYGAQLEQGSYPTSYIPTYGSSSTRLKDTIATLSSPAIAGATEWTLAFDNTDSVVENTGQLVYRVNSTTSKYSAIFTSGNISFYNNISGFFGEAGIGKICIKYDGTTFHGFSNGVKVQSKEAIGFGTTSNISVIDPNGLSGPLHKMLFFKTALSDDECIALTTI